MHPGKDEWFVVTGARRPTPDFERAADLLVKARKKNPAAEIAGPFRTRDAARLRLQQGGV